MAKKKRTAAQFFDDAETNGLESLATANVNDDKVSKHLESGTEINYNRMLVLWNEWVLISPFTALKYCRFMTDNELRWNRYERRNLGASPCEIKTAKHFMKGVVRGCCAGKDEPFMYIMLQKWTDFDAGWKRRPDNDKISSEMSKSIYFVYIQSFGLLFLYSQDLTVLTSIYKSSYERSSNFQSLDELDTS